MRASPHYLVKAIGCLGRRRETCRFATASSRSPRKRKRLPFTSPPLRAALLCLWSMHRKSAGDPGTIRVARQLDRCSTGLATHPRASRNPRPPHIGLTRPQSLRGRLGALLYELLTPTTTGDEQLQCCWSVLHAPVTELQVCGVGLGEGDGSGHKKGAA
jgi:hypothetical protein